MGVHASGCGTAIPYRLSAANIHTTPDMHERTATTYLYPIGSACGYDNANTSSLKRMHIEQGRCAALRYAHGHVLRKSMCALTYLNTVLYFRFKKRF